MKQLFVKTLSVICSLLFLIISILLIFGTLTRPEENLNLFLYIPFVFVPYLYVVVRAWEENVLKNQHLIIRFIMLCSVLLLLFADVLGYFVSKNVYSISSIFYDYNVSSTAEVAMCELVGLLLLHSLLTYYSKKRIIPNA